MSKIQEDVLRGHLTRHHLVNGIAGFVGGFGAVGLTLIEVNRQREASEALRWSDRIPRSQGPCDKRQTRTL